MEAALGGVAQGLYQEAVYSPGAVGRRMLLAPVVAVEAVDNESQVNMWLMSAVHSRREEALALGHRSTLDDP